MNKIIKIEVNDNINRFINKCINNKIYISNINYINDNKIIQIILTELKI